MRELLSRGAAVTVLDDFSCGRRENLPASAALQVVEADVSTAETVQRIVPGCDLVFHLAAQVGHLPSMADAAKDARVNIMGTVRLLQACQDTGVQKVVLASSSAVYGEAVTRPIDEDHPRTPVSFYGLSKLSAERYAALAASLWAVPAVSLRYFNVYGAPMAPDDRAGVIAVFLRRLRAGDALTIQGDGTQARDFVAVDDVVRATLLAAVRAPAGAVYNVGSGRATNIAELADAAMRVTGRRVPIARRAARPGDVRDSVAAIGRAQAELGYEPRVGLTEGLGGLWDRLLEERRSGTPESADKDR